MPCWRDPHNDMQTGTLLWSVLGVCVCVWGPHCSVEMEEQEAHPRAVLSTKPWRREGSLQ